MADALTSDLDRELKLANECRDSAVSELSLLLRRAVAITKIPDFSAKGLILRRKLSYATDHLQSKIKEFEDFVPEPIRSEWLKQLKALSADRTEELKRDPLRVRPSDVVRELQLDSPKLATLNLTLVDSQLFTACWALLIHGSILSLVEQQKLVDIIVAELKQIGSGFYSPDDWSSVAFGLLSLTRRRDFPHGTLLQLIATVFAVDGMRDVWQTPADLDGFYDMNKIGSKQPRFMTEQGRHRIAAERNGDLNSDFRSCTFLVLGGLKISDWLFREAHGEQWRGVRDEVRSWTNKGLLYLKTTLFGPNVEEGADLLPSRVLDFKIARARLAPIARLIYLNVLHLMLFADLNKYRYEAIRTAVGPLPNPELLLLMDERLGR